MTLFRTYKYIIEIQTSSGPQQYTYQGNRLSLRGHLAINSLLKPKVISKTRV